MSKKAQIGQLNAEDLRRFGWEEVLDGEEIEGYPRISSRLRDASKQLYDDGDVRGSNVLRLLADACSMMLKPTSSDEPFVPMCVMEGRRSTIPDDFSDENLDFFSEATSEIGHVRISARLADLLWVRRRDHNMARVAIDTYQEVPLDDNLSRDGIECWERAISLAREIGDGQRRSKLIAAVQRALRGLAERDGPFCLSLSKLLWKEKLGEDDVLEIAEILVSRAAKYRESNNYGRAERYFGSAVKWFSRSEDKSRETVAKVAHAACCGTRAEAHLSSDPPNNLAAGHQLEKAIQLYRSVPKSERAKFAIDEKLQDLHGKMSEANKASLDQMTAVATGAVDLTEIVQRSRDLVSGKSWPEALCSLALISRGPQLAALKETVREVRKENPLQFLVSKSYVLTDGRVIAKREGQLPVGNNARADNVCSTEDLVECFRRSIEFDAQALILPALEAAREEHSVGESDFIEIAEKSPIVPTGRAHLVGKSLYFGFSGDFGTSLHLLVPQVEHIVRVELKAKGGSTTRYESGVETENSLNALVKLPEMKKGFGKDIAFEIEALFCESTGPNLRNDVAHGLVDDHRSESSWSVYAWHLLLRLVLLPMVQIADDEVVADADTMDR